MSWIGWVDYVGMEEVAGGQTDEEYHLEAIRIRLRDARPMSVCYRAYVGGLGWQGGVCDDQEAGTTGLFLPLLGLSIWLPNAPLDCSIRYQVYLAGLGWTETVQDGVVAGLHTDEEKILAVRIGLTPACL